MLPFTVDEFLAVFARYNQAIWPTQVVAYSLGIAGLGLMLRPGVAPDRMITGILALQWVWTGIAYHALYFTAINPAAWLFGVAFGLQGALLLFEGIWRNRLPFGPVHGPGAIFGWFLAGYALVLYPLIGAWTGHVFPETPIFGVTPCPVTLYTIGLLLLTTRPVPKYLLVIPVLWSVIGGSAALLLQMPQDWVLLAGGVLGTLSIVIRDATKRHKPEHATR